MAGARNIDGPAAFATAFSVSRETIAKFETYAALLKQWQRAVNLVAPSTLPDVWHRHFADSAQLKALIPPPVAETKRRHVDLGSGGGFPGLVLALLWGPRGDVATTLVESDQRKCAFLREVARATGIAVEIVTERIENRQTRDMVGTVDVVTARALAPLDRLFALSEPMCSSSTVGLFLKGRGVEAELEEARRRWRFEHRLIPSVTQQGAFVVEVRHLSPVAA